jgi:hypothetical protein
MKKLTSIYALLVTSLFLISCGGNDTKSKKSNVDFLPPIAIEIPDNIKSDDELVEVVKSSEKAINEFSDNIERIAVDGKDVLNKKDEDLTLMDQMKIAKMAVEFISNSTQMAQALDQFNTYVEKKQSQGIINDEQLKALEQVSISFTERMDQIEAKYDKYYNK